MNHAIRITLPFSDCSGIISQWASRCVSVVAYQHDADEEVSKTHVHLGLYKCEVRFEALKRMWPDAPGSGNGFWSFKSWDVEVENGFTKPNTYITYMTKGNLRPVFVKNISMDLLEESRQAWVEPVKADKSEGSSERVVNEVMKYFNIKNDVGYYRHVDDVVDFGQPKYNLELLLKNVRSQTFKVLWRQHRMAPHASHYKIIASTAFLRICEEAGCFEQAVSEIQNLWY